MAEPSILNKLPRVEMNHILRGKENAFDASTDIPEVIKGTYKDDFNIIEVHETILKRLKLIKPKKIKELKDKIEYENFKLNNASSILDEKNARRLIDTYTQECNKIENDHVLKEYLSLSTDLIEQYRELGTLKTIISLDSPQIENEEDINKSNYRHYLIYKYLDIARKYIQVEVVRETKNIIRCDECDAILESNDVIPICPKCGAEKETNLIPNVRNPSVRNRYEDRLNFYKGILIFQGKFQVKLPDNWQEKLDEYFKSYSLPTAEEIRKMPLVQGRKENTSKELMYQALGKVNLSNLYKHTNLLCNLYWGWDLPDISSIEDNIMRDYDLSEQVVNTLVKGKKSRINREFRLYQLLRKNDYECSPEDFRIIKTQDILEYYINLWSQVCDQLNWKLFPIS